MHPHVHDGRDLEVRPVARDPAPQVVARMDSKADRKPKTFIIRNLVFEPWFDEADALFGLLAARLWEFATFNGCERFAIEQVEPSKLRAPLETALAEREGQ